MKNNMPLKLIVLDDYSEISDSPIARKLYADMLHLKLSGYRDKYPKGVLPIDGTDHVAKHYIVCEPTFDGYRPIMGYRALSLDRCQKHRKRSI